MKITHTVLMVASALLLAGGCAQEQQHHARNNGNIAPAYSPDGTRLPDSYYGENPPNHAPSTSNDTSSSPSFSSYPPSANVKRSDDAVAADAREALLRNAEIAAIVPNIQITANDGVLLLSGSAQSEEQTRQIQSIVERTKGVVAVNNQLQFPGKTTSESGNAMGTTNNAENPMLNPTSNSSNSLPRLYNDAGSNLDNFFNTNTVNPESGNQMP